MILVKLHTIAKGKEDSFTILADNKWELEEKIHDITSIRYVESYWMEELVGE